MAPKSLTDAFPRMSLVEKQGRALRGLIPFIAGLLATLEPQKNAFPNGAVPFLPPAPDSEVQ